MQEVIGSTPLFSTSFKSPQGDFLRFSYLDFTVYIVYSEMLDRYYVGYTGNINVRLQQHNDGISEYTSSANDWRLMYKEAFSTREAAMAREREIKREKSRKYIEWLISSAG
jgi:putative endonuclease